MKGKIDIWLIVFIVVLFTAILIAAQTEKRTDTHPTTTIETCHNLDISSTKNRCQ